MGRGVEKVTPAEREAEAARETFWYRYGVCLNPDCCVDRLSFDRLSAGPGVIVPDACLTAHDIISTYLCHSCRESHDHWLAAEKAAKENPT